MWGGVAAAMTHVEPTLPRWRRYPRRGKRSKLPPQPFDKRTRLGRRVTALVRMFRERLGDAGNDPVLLVAVERAARLTAFAELLSARALRGQDVSADDVIRAHRASDMAMRRLQLDRHKQPAS